MPPDQKIPNEFDVWNEKKKTIDARLLDALLYCLEREIWWCAMGKNIGDENNGKNEFFERPVIIFRKFGESMIWVIPLTTQEKGPGAGDRYFYQFTCKGVTQNACLSQIRPVSIKRLLRFIDITSPEDFQEIRKRIIDLI